VEWCPSRGAACRRVIVLRLRRSRRERPFEPALLVLRMNRALARFTSSAPNGENCKCNGKCNGNGEEGSLPAAGRLRCAPFATALRAGRMTCKRKSAEVIGGIGRKMLARVVASW
jgi:hypothetical protein